MRLWAVLSARYRPASLLVHSLYTGVDGCVAGGVEINNENTGRNTKNVRMETSTDRDAKDGGRGGGEVEDVMG